MESKVEKVKLSNGVEMPILGYGVYQIPPEKTEECVLNALKSGYRSIDTAFAYQNEVEVGKAIKKSGIPREELFITTKVFVFDAGYEKTKEAFNRSLERLGLDYIDLYLIHLPFGDNFGSWRAMEELYEAKKVRAIGVSNFAWLKLMDFCSNVKIVPMVNQFEFNPFWQRKNDMQIMKKYNIVAEAWGPLGEAKPELLNDPTIVEISKKYNKTPAQVILRFINQLGVVAIPKTVNIQRMEENINIWDFKLDDDDMQKMKSLDKNKALLLDYDDLPSILSFWDLLDSFKKNLK